MLRNIETNGITLRAAVEGEGPMVMLVHGWPELWYSWRHQIRHQPGRQRRRCTTERITCKMIESSAQPALRATMTQGVICPASRFCIIFATFSRKASTIRM